MLDPNKLIEMLTNMTAMSQSTQQSLTQSFMSGAAGMNMNGAGEMEKIMSQMSQMSEKAALDMGDMMKTFQQECSMMKTSQQESNMQVRNGEKESEQGGSFPQGAMDFFTNMQKK
ncbi:DUF6277 family protein [Serratia sp. AKBS12]|uniref:DUF6277 family protein n=1 Tax=Serratia sp. AKBS12 TaxID=2974597 RepID=UPI002165BC62|nr:DUF6277 family protein [Serratia sp. AKBS12]MCS3408374.1 DUF6277 family protein [Serratia sp. AKBS12]HEI8864712.1 hypothetical protein [Serratia odorifera]